MAKGTNKEVEGIRQDIRDIVDGLDPEVQGKWFGYKPNSSSSRKAAFSPLSSLDKKSKRSHSKHKADENVPEDNVTTNCSVEMIPSPKKRTKRKRQSTHDDDPDEDDKPVVDMSCYVYVETPPPPSVNVRNRPKKALPLQTTELGPYTFKSNIVYPEFLHMLAKGCQAKSTSNLALASMRWKFDRPKTLEKKSLTNTIPWIEQENNNAGQALDFEYNINIVAPNAVKSIHEQILNIDTGSQAELNELLEKYPVNNDPTFPDKRIFRNKTGHFDLTDIKLHVWAVAIANSTATIDKPPASTHFFKNQTIRPSRSSGLPAPTQPADAQNIALQSNMPPPFPNPYHLPFLNPYGLYFPQQFTTPPHYSLLPPPHPPGPPFMPQLPLPPTMPQPSSTSEPVELPCIITLDEYCNHHKLNNEDRRILLELGYIPSDDRIKELDSTTWEMTNARPLVKSRILRQHDSFLKDVSKGLWDEKE